MKCVLNMATRHGWYPLGQRRLAKTLYETGYRGDTMFISHESEVGAPPHQENPYAFKPYAIQRAIDIGYDEILWMDASLYCVKSVQPLFDWAEIYGYFLEEAGHYVGRWSNDQCLKYFGLSRGQAWNIGMFSAGLQCLNMNFEITREYFSLWKKSCDDGMFKGSWDDHRHDMTCGSIIAHKLGMVLSQGGYYMAYVGPGYVKPSETSIIHAQGILMEEQ